MAVEKIVSEEIVDEKKYKRFLSTTHIRFEGKSFTQYNCNPTPEKGMRQIPADTLFFSAHVVVVNGRDYSYIIEAIGRSGKVTYHCSA